MMMIGTIEHPALIAGAYGMLGRELKRVGLLDDSWKPTKPRDCTAEDRELVDLFRKIEIHLAPHGTGRIEKWSLKVNDAIMALPNRGDSANMTLLALYLVLHWSELVVGPFAKLMESRATSLIDTVSGEVRNQAGHEVARFTARAADNIARYLTGRPVLDNEIRDAFWRRIHSRAQAGGAA